MSDKKAPVGGRKGGTQFPQIALSQAVGFAKKLVSKVHTGPQSETVILKGVFNNSGSDGKIRASALKQFDLMSGLSSAYDATDLARSINSAPDDELLPLLAKACLAPKLFKILYDTFQNDTVSRSKIRQQALQLKVHPESGDKCVAIFIESLLFAKLGMDRSGDIQIHGISQPSESKGAAKTADESEFSLNDNSSIDRSDNSLNEQEENQESQAGTEQHRILLTQAITPKAQFQVALNLDTMDPEKLEKHMKILKRYGVIG